MPKNKESIYLETSVISAYFDFKNQDKERKKITRRFFKEELQKYKIFISDVVIKEIENTPDNNQKLKFLKFIKNFNKLSLNPEIIKLANNYIKKKIIPSAKLFDAYHLAIASLNKVNILLSWNYNHIANKITQEKVNKFNIKNNYPKITIEFPIKLLTPKQKI